MQPVAQPVWLRFEPLPKDVLQYIWTHSHSLLFWKADNEGKGSTPARSPGEKLICIPFSIFAYALRDAFSSIIRSSASSSTGIVSVIFCFCVERRRRFEGAMFLLMFSRANSGVVSNMDPPRDSAISITKHQNRTILNDLINTLPLDSCRYRPHGAYGTVVISKCGALTE